MPGHTVEVAAGAITLVGTGGCAVALAALHLLPTGMSPLSNAVSQYGITAYKTGYRIQTIAMGIAALAAAVGLSDAKLHGEELTVVLLVIFGAARLAISWSPMDDPNGPRTETGRRHGLLALAAFGAATIAALRLPSVLSAAHRWSGARGAITGIAIEMLVSLIAMGVVRLAMGVVRRSPQAHRYFGLVERAFYVGAIAFLVVVGVELLRAR
jgi:hypothetical protein